MGFREKTKPLATPAEAHEPGRGRHAELPHQVPPAGWLDILTRTGQQISADNISIVAAGVAFFAFVALVPALGALIGIYGLISDPAQVGAQVTALARILPHEALPLLEQQLRRITTNVHTASWSATIGLLVAIFSSASAIKALLQGLDIGYEEREKRSFLRLNAFALLLTLCAIVAGLIAVTLLAVLPTVLDHLNIGPATNQAIKSARWVVLVGGFMASLAVLYRYGPSRREAKWAWVSWGAMSATILWVIGSALFSLYVSKFGSYDKTYGSLGAVVVFLMWMYLSAFAILCGAELNSEMERQTLKDTTEGKPKPLGQRGARAADTVGPSRKALRAADRKSRPPKRPRRDEQADEHP